MLTYDWLETRDKKPPPHTSLLSSPHLRLLQISLATRFPRGAGITPWSTPAAGIHAAGAFIFTAQCECVQSFDYARILWSVDVERGRKTKN